MYKISNRVVDSSRGKAVNEGGFIWFDAIPVWGVQRSACQTTNTLETLRRYMSHIRVLAFKASGLEIQCTFPGSNIISYVYVPLDIAKPTRRGYSTPILLHLRQNHTYFKAAKIVSNGRHDGLKFEHHFVLTLTSHAERIYDSKRGLQVPGGWPQQRQSYESAAHLS